MTSSPAARWSGSWLPIRIVAPATKESPVDQVTRLQSELEATFAGMHFWVFFAARKPDGTVEFTVEFTAEESDQEAIH